MEKIMLWILMIKVEKKFSKGDLINIRFSNQ